MKLKFTPVETAPDRYEIDGTDVTAIFDDGEQESFDVSMPKGAKMVPGGYTTVLSKASDTVLRDLYADEVTGELHLGLAQRIPVSKITYIKDGRRINVPLGDPDGETPEPPYDRVVYHRAGDWEDSDWIDAADYDPSILYIKRIA